VEPLREGEGAQLAGVLEPTQPRLDLGVDEGAGDDPEHGGEAVELARRGRHERGAGAVARHHEAGAEDEPADDHRPKEGGVVELHRLEVEDPDAGEDHRPDHRAGDAGEHHLQDGHVAAVELAHELLGPPEPAALQDEAERDAHRDGDGQPHRARVPGERVEVGEVREGERHRHCLLRKYATA
jgi:hypothetical protein